MPIWRFEQSIVLEDNRDITSCHFIDAKLADHLFNPFRRDRLPQASHCHMMLKSKSCFQTSCWQHIHPARLPIFAQLTHCPSTLSAVAAHGHTPNHCNTFATQGGAAAAKMAASTCHHHHTPLRPLFRRVITNEPQSGFEVVCNA